ncbi:hypothetical protein [Flavobacterium sp. LHD-85]|uniref:hypothetical protein n=1 Tax=Flavobacterium sp. LHD-85 TaxID=3071410 RepID=UPI0027DF9857|nr:hypothetical protein [Flavobacterium sp. LHD-85]MDQ6530799.1 hypothetical protein [Flavobacterium sp. LHD-85]
MRTDTDNRKSANLNDFKCSKPDHIDTAHENEAMDQEYTSGQDQDNHYKNKFAHSSDDCYEIVESGLNLAEDNTPFSTYDTANLYDSYNLDNEDAKYNCPLIEILKTKNFKVVISPKNNSKITNEYLFNESFYFSHC